MKRLPVLALILSFLAFGQQFRSETVKPAVGAAGERFPVSVRAGLTGKMTIRNAGLKDCIVWAWSLPGGYVIDGNGQLFPDRYDIDAQSATVPTAEKYRKMLQSLLADRFGLQVHREARPTPFYSLAIADQGFGLQKSKEGKAKFQLERKGLTAENVSMKDLAIRLSGILNRPVVDDTGMAGAFHLKVGWTQEELKERSAGAALRFFKSLQEQTGLRLVEKQNPVEMLVVDHAEKPKP
jgi:uncharacterized protein (TIGR03435 family)